LDPRLLGTTVKAIAPAKGVLNCHSAAGRFGFLDSEVAAATTLRICISSTAVTALHNHLTGDILRLTVAGLTVSS